MPTVVIRFTGSRTLTSWAIQVFTWSHYSHVGIELGDGNVISALPGTGVCILPEASATIGGAASTTTRFSVTVPEGTDQQIYFLAKQEVGKPYDWAAIFGMLIHRDIGDRANTWDCSMFVDYIFRAAGQPLIRTEHLDRITPRDLLLAPALVLLP